MSKSYRLTVCFLSLLLAACESDEAKLKRLNGDRAVHCILAPKYAEDYKVASKKPWAPARDTLLQKWNEHNTKCELATRDLARFMR